MYTIREAMRCLPYMLPGFGFHLTDQQLITHYLKRKAHDEHIEFDIIPEVDIYMHEPWDLPAKDNVPPSDSKWHFFMPGHGKYQNGSYPNRDTKLGYWRAIQSKYNIKHDNKVVGTKQTLAFYEGQHPTGRRTEWVMHEYYLHENECKDAPELKDRFALCLVTKTEDPDHLNADASAPEEVNCLEQSNGMAKPVMYSNM